MDFKAIEFRIYEFNTLKNYIWADVVAIYNGKWIFSKHKKRSTWESQGGHIEIGETVLEAAKRELHEEAGAIDFDIVPLCDYWLRGTIDGKMVIGNSQVYFANVHTLGDIPANSEMEKICLFDSLPGNLTYHEVIYEIYPLALQKRQETIILQNKL
jgi:8-oxo-dGTP diphosphatase